MAASWPIVRRSEATLRTGDEPATRRSAVAHLRRAFQHLDRADLLFVAAVAIAYVVAASLAAATHGLIQDRMMVLAERVVQGRLDDPTFANTVDSVVRDGRYYVAVGPLQVVPYLPFVPFPALYGVAGYIAGLAVGIPAGWLALPLARAYQARSRTATWVAVFIACGTLLFYVSVFGDIYYLAHAESFLALELFLIEWAGQRRPGILGALLAVSFLARPITILASIPFGLVLIWRNRSWIRDAIVFAAPLVGAIVLYAAFNYLRFGSPLESGYAISVLHDRSLIARRAKGVFSIRQVPENIRLALLALPRLSRSFPFIAPDPYGMSMLLVSPGLLVAARAGIRQPLQRLLWVTAAIIAIPVLLYYGGGFDQYGFRYSLDFTPFLAALVALAAASRFGRVERLLFIVSVVSVSYGILWHASR